MESANKAKITVESTIAAPVETVWELWTAPEHITKWNSPSDDWHTPSATNDLRTGGAFLSRMEARDGSVGFDFSGVYDEVKPHELIAYTLDDGRKVHTTFTNQDGGTAVTTVFEAESENSIEMQQAGWQAISDSFKKYAEAR